MDREKTDEAIQTFAKTISWSEKSPMKPFNRFDYFVRASKNDVIMVVPESGLVLRGFDQSRVNSFSNNDHIELVHHSIH